MALLRTDYRSNLIRRLRQTATFLVLGLYMYLLYDGRWGIALLLVSFWVSFFREVVTLFSPVLEVIVVSRPLIPYYRKVATAQGLLAQDFGSTIHPLGLF